MDSLLAAGLVMILAPFIFMAVLALSFILDLVLAWPLMWAWNYAVPFLFGFKAISYWHAFCLLVVSTLLIKSPAGTSSSGKNS